MYYQVSKKDKTSKVREFMQDTWKGFTRKGLEEMLSPQDTSYSSTNLKAIAKVVSTVPKGVKFLRKAERILRDRSRMVFESDKIDWGMGETLAYGSLLHEGFDVRISGQDVADKVLKYKNELND